jgi:hypothetical protein
MANAARIQRIRAQEHQAAAKVLDYISICEEHLSEAERNDNPVMADFFRTILDGLYAAGMPERGVASIDLQLIPKGEVTL